MNISKLPCVAIQPNITNIPNTKQMQADQQIELLKNQITELTRQGENFQKQIELSEKQLSELKQHTEKMQEQIKFAKKEAKSAKIESCIAIGISVLAIIIEILLNLLN